MNLYATGFNAWRQLQFLPSENATEEPDDILSFQKVLSDKLVDVRYASLTFTVVSTSTGLQYAGSVDEGIGLEFCQKLLSSTAAIAGNGVIAVYNGNSTISQYTSLRQLTGAGGDQVFTGMGRIIQLVACETSFVALTEDGKIWTWGDERYAATLGRDITSSCPAERPGLVEDLEHLPSGKIDKIAAGGYTVLALTEGHDLYAWGGHPGRPAIIEALSSSPSPVDVEDNDILDCSAGEAHIILLTTGGNVYVIGDNINGQLGLQLERATKWLKVPTPPVGEDVVSVKAGHRGSFIVTKNTRLA